jgi:hypothetical protein
MSFFSFFKCNKTNKRTRKRKQTRSKRGGMTSEDKYRQEQMEVNRRKWEKIMFLQNKNKREGKYLPPFNKRGDQADHLIQNSEWQDLNQSYKDNINYVGAELDGVTFGGKVKKSRRKR